MATTNTDLIDAIAPLTEEAKEMAQELEHEQNSSNLKNARTPPRWISLSPFKDVATEWEWVDKNREGSISPLALSSSSMHLPSCGCQICNVKQEEAQSEFSIESEEAEADPVEKANCRVLGVLTCYLYNLENSMLVTGSKVDERVEGSLKKLLGKEHLCVACRTQAEGGFSKGTRESWEISDEELVAAEIESYKRKLDVHGEELPKDVVEAASEILEWAKTKGTVHGREGDVSSARTSFEMIEC